MGISLTEQIFQTLKLPSKYDLLSYITVKRSLEGFFETQTKRAGPIR